MALVPLNTFKTKTAILTTLKYNQAKCSRDTGLIIDSIAFDLLFGDSTHFDTQSRFAALQYWSQSDTEIPGEVFQTLSAMEHAKQVAMQLIVNTTVVKSRGNTQTQNTSGTASTAAVQQLIEDEFNIIIDIIQNGTAGITDRIISNVYPGTSNTDITNAINTLTNNKTFLQHEVVAYVNEVFGAGYQYDRTKCKRDTGLIIDSLSFDLRFNGNTQSMFAGMQYWAPGTSTLPTIESNETTLTNLALGRAKSVAKQIVLNQTVVKSSGNVTPQVIDSTILGSVPSQTTVESLFTNITNIISTGPAAATIDGVVGIGVTNGIVPNGSVTNDIGFFNASLALQLNKQFMQDEVMAWINVQVAAATLGSPWYGFDYNTTNTTDADLKAAKCRRDVGYIVDCISFDLKYGGNRQSLQAGTYYWNYSVSESALSYSVSISAATMKAGVSYIIATNPDNTQFVSYGSNNNVVGTLFVASGPIVGSAATVYKASEISETISGYEYLKNIISSVIEGQPIATIYQNEIQQVITSNYGTSTQSGAAVGNIDLINGIISNGPDTSLKYAISLDESMDINDVYAAELLLLNKEFIKAEIIAYIDTTTQYNFVNAYDMISGEQYTIQTVGNTNFTSFGAPNNNIGTTFKANFSGTISSTNTGVVIAGFTYPNATVFDDTNYCFRDIGFIVDCIKFDLLYSGNRQAVQAGVYYFKNSATLSVVASEKTDTINAYKYLKLVMDRVLSASTLTTAYIHSLTTQDSVNFYSGPYQTEVVQNVNLPKPVGTEVDDMSTIVDSITTIINYGPDLTVNRVPIPVGTTPSIDKVNAYNIIEANRDFIIAEVIGYMNSLTSPNTTKIYTTPPGITAIVLMAQVANVTDHDIKITFCHYRNLPAAIDPATLNGYQAPNTTTEIVKEYIIPPNDAASLIQGKLIIESFDSIVAYASESHGLKVTLSILETANA